MAIDSITVNKELMRCVPCKHCGGRPEIRGVANIVCENFNSCVGDTHTGYCGCIYMSPYNGANLAEARSLWNRTQRNSDVRKLAKGCHREARAKVKELYPITSESSPLEVANHEKNFLEIYKGLREDKLLAQVAAARAHATKLGKLAELRKEKIKILQEELSKFAALKVLEEDVVEKFRAVF
jgi:hypothetical protein